MLIIIEGCDGVGKTSLAENLRFLLGEEDTEVWHRGVPERHPLEEYVIDLEGYRPGSGKNIITDRWHLGELVYGRLYRGETKLGWPGRAYVDLFLRSRGALLVHLTTTPEVVRKRLASRGEDYLQDEHVEHVLEGFWHESQESTVLPVVNVASPESHSDITTIMHVAEALEYSVLTLPQRYIGHPFPEVLLLGEERGPGVGTRYPASELPFVPFPGTSGRYLMESLDPTFVPFIGIANALENDVDDLLKRLGDPAVVALGRKSKEALRASGRDGGTVPHPQYVRRFHHARREEYGALIQVAAKTGEDMSRWPKEQIK